MLFVWVGVAFLTKKPFGGKGIHWGREMAADRSRLTPCSVTLLQGIPDKP
jgi:hypothetical protein